MRVSIVGAGYVGLVTAACLAEKGHELSCVDLDPGRVARINRGQSPIFERGLSELLAKHAGQRLSATTDLRAAVSRTELTLVAVGTPFDGSSIDLRLIERAALELGAALREKAGRHTVVVKSTVVPGTTDGVIRAALESASGKRAGPDFGLGVNPEFLTEGEAVSDFMEPDRIVIGAFDERTRGALAELYSGFPGAELVHTNDPTAEMIKYASNALLATLISFSNELANLGAEIGGIDTVDVSRGLRASRYLACTLADGSRSVAPIFSFLLAGCGFGGSCLPKDVAALNAEGRRRGLPMALLDAVLRVNAAQPFEVIRRLERHFPNLSGKRISVLGLAFRPDTDDLRESPAIPIVRELASRGARIRGYDPAASANARTVFGDQLELCESLEQALLDCDAAVLVTRWSEFEAVPELIARLNPGLLLVDGRRMLPKDRIARYEGIGL
jgi:UDPglucose 6-dehydrogenase/GDP-mannose 6-dehydrogenase